MGANNNRGTQKGEERKREMGPVKRTLACGDVVAEREEEGRKKRKD